MNRSGVGSQATTTYSFDVDPCVILGVSATATLQEIRDAYRAKALKHHPDHGGEEWVFRVVARAYEIMSTARVAGRVAQESPRRAENVRPFRPRPAPSPDSEWHRPGHRDPWIDDERMVDVEVLLLRFEMRNPTDLLLLAPEERNLSCCLNVSWSAPSRGLGKDEDPERAMVRGLLADTFKEVASKTHAASSWSSAERGTFVGWLSYPTATRAWEAFRSLHAALNNCGLGVNQWTRDMIIPRSGR